MRSNQLFSIIKIIKPPLKGILKKNGKSLLGFNAMQRSSSSVNQRPHTRVLPLFLLPSPPLRPQRGWLQFMNNRLSPCSAVIAAQVPPATH